MAHITQQEIAGILRVYMGSAALASQPDFPGFLAKKFTSWLYIDKTLDQMREDLHQDLMLCIFAASGRTMKLRMDDGRLGVWTEDAVDALADCLLEVLFYHLPRTDYTYRALFDYALRHQSHSAFKALYLYYDAFHQPADRTYLIRMIREQFAPADYQRWLDAADA